MLLLHVLVQDIANLAVSSLNTVPDVNWLMCLSMYPCNGSIRHISLSICLFSDWTQVAFYHENIWKQNFLALFSLPFLLIGCSPKTCPLNDIRVDKCPETDCSEQSGSQELITYALTSLFENLAMFKMNIHHFNSLIKHTRVQFNCQIRQGFWSFPLTRYTRNWTHAFTKMSHCGFIRGMKHVHQTCIC